MGAARNFDGMTAALLCDIPVEIEIYQLFFQDARQLHNRPVIFFHCVAGAGGKNGNTGVNAVMQRECVTVETEFPVNRIKIVFLADELDPEVATQNIGHVVEAFQSTVIINNGFGAA